MTVGKYVHQSYSNIFLNEAIFSRGQQNSKFFEKLPSQPYSLFVIICKHYLESLVDRI